MKITLDKFTGYSLEDAKRIAKTRSYRLLDTFYVLQRNSDGAYVVTFRLYPDEARLIETFDREADA